MPGEPASSAHASATDTPRHIDARAVTAVQRRLAGLPTAPWLHLEIAGRMAQRLSLFKTPPQRIVDWSSFLGGGVPRLTAAYPDAHLTAIEPSEALAARSRAALRAPWWSRRRWHSTAAEVMLDAATPETPVQLVWANMLLHGMADPPALMQRWQGLLAPGGFVMFSCLGPDTVRGLTALYRRLGYPPPTLPFVDMHDLGDMLMHAGFADPVMDQETLTVQWDSAPALCKDVRLLGGNVAPDRFQGLRTPRWRAGLYREMEALRDAGGRFSLSFEIVYGHAFKADAPAAVSTETQVPLDEMRRLLRASRKTTA